MSFGCWNTDKWTTTPIDESPTHYCGFVTSLWPIVMRTFPSGSRASSRCRHVDYHPLIVANYSQRFHGMACKKVRFTRAGPAVTVLAYAYTIFIQANVIHSDIFTLLNNWFSLCFTLMFLLGSLKRDQSAFVPRRASMPKTSKVQHLSCSDKITFIF